MNKIKNRAIYLERIEGPVKEKLKAVSFIDKSVERILDVGSANGAITIEIARLFPKASILGIDLDKGFIQEAQTRAKDKGVKNVQFELVYLRDLLARSQFPQAFGAITFVSVLHEFFSYGEGISSVLKALADAHELLAPGGRIIVRDMILPEYMGSSRFRVDSILKKITKANMYKTQFADFCDTWGKPSTLAEVNHFLLKYGYVENWARECSEYYTPVSFEQYHSIFALLGMEMEHEESYTLPFIVKKWQEDLGLSAEETGVLRSTGIIVARRPT